MAFVWNCWNRSAGTFFAARVVNGRRETTRPLRKCIMAKMGSAWDHQSVAGCEYDAPKLEVSSSSAVESLKSGA